MEIKNKVKEDASKWRKLCRMEDLEFTAASI